MTDRILTCTFAALVLSGLILALTSDRALAGEPPSRYHEEQLRADALYESGEYAEAMKHYRKLARKGDTFSQYRVSFMYLEGLGEEEDVVEAFAWATLAAQNRQKELVDYRDTVGSLVPPKHHRKAVRRVDYYLRKWGNAAIADDAARGARRDLRNCTGSRVGTRCEEVYAMQMPNFWGIDPGHGGGTRGGEGEGGSAAVSGSVSSGQTEGGGGATRDIAYYQQLRARLRALDRYIGAQGNVELGEFEVIEDAPTPKPADPDGS